MLPSGAERERRTTTQARKLLHNRLDADYGLAELATEMGLTKFHLIRSFKRKYGITPHAYQMQLRVARARKLLATGMPATDVAHASGFYDQSHLTRWFKRVVGMTPGSYARSAPRA